MRQGHSSSNKVKINNLGFEFTDEFTELTQKYDIKSSEVNKRIWESFYNKTDEIPYLKTHRDYIEKFNYGYGNRPLHFMWKLLIDHMPKKFKFLEIGVFKGQIISLVQLISEKEGKKPYIWGITPLTAAGDKYSEHPDINYVKAIKKVYRDFGLNFKNTKLIKGFSQDRKVVEKARQQAPFDIIFIDGCHEYEAVVNDLINYSNLVRKGGFMVIDDASNYVKTPKYVNPSRGKLKRALGIGKVAMFSGFYEVSNAIRDILDKDTRFIHLFACGHDRVWLKVK